MVAAASGSRHLSAECYATSRPRAVSGAASRSQPMNAPKRWIDTEGGSNDFERALLEPAVQIEIPPGAEQNVWLGLAGLVASASPPVAAATAGAGGAQE